MKLAQDITIVKINENEHTLSECSINGAFLTEIKNEITDYKNKYPLLFYIDPWGNTYFNDLQKADLLRELEMLKFESFMEIYKDDIDKIISFISLLLPHEYIKFVGD